MTRYRQTQQYNRLDNPAHRSALLGRVRVALNSGGGNVSAASRLLEVDRTTLWRWITELGLIEELDTIRADNRPQRKPKSFGWLMKHKPDEARDIVKDVLWRNDGIVEACAIEMRVAKRTMYFRIEKLGLGYFLARAQDYTDRKRDAGVAPPPTEHPRPSPHLHPPSPEDTL